MSGKSSKTRKKNVKIRDFGRKILSKAVEENNMMCWGADAHTTLFNMTFYDSLGMFLIIFSDFWFF